MRDLKSERARFQAFLKERSIALFSRAGFEPGPILRTLGFLGAGVLSWLGFSYVLTLYIKILQGRSIVDFPWHYDAPIYAFKDSLAGAAIIIFVKWKFGLLSEKSKHAGRDFFVLVFLIPVVAASITAFSILILGNSYTGRKNPDAYDWVMGFLHQLILQIFVIFTCIGYFYLALVNQTKKRLSETQRARAEMELKALQQNIEPHFLFNNLNVLSSLIESNPARANEFLSRLAELYRYILQTRSLEIVPLKDELNFAESYIYLLRERFGRAYNFVWEVDENKLDGRLIVPVALQTLIENAVKHNAGNQREPLRIAVRLDADFITVENDRREKTQIRPTNRTGLQNLKARYALLTKEPVEIRPGAATFTVRLPLMKNK